MGQDLHIQHQFWKLRAKCSIQNWKHHLSRFQSRSNKFIFLDSNSCTTYQSMQTVKKRHILLVRGMVWIWNTHMDSCVCMLSPQLDADVFGGSRVLEIYSQAGHYIVLLLVLSLLLPHQDVHKMSHWTPHHHCWCRHAVMLASIHPAMMTGNYKWK